MKIAWIFPVNQKCGISFYSREYVNALGTYIKVAVFDIDECLNKPKQSVKNLNRFDCIHIQYETSFFLKGKKKKYSRLCTLLTKPVVATLHEVYDEFPGVFPRSHITGSGILRVCKEYIWDRRHPCQNVYTFHANNRFFADRLLVHANYHKQSLIKKGIEADTISVIPHPVKIHGDSPDLSFMKENRLNLSSHGFISPHYDYALLFNVLEKLTVPWRFTWIGGIRRDEDAPLLAAINRDIAKRSWQDTFIITGWAEDEKRNRLLTQTDIYLALFTARSTSGSLATTMGMHRLIITTELQYTLELAQNAPALTVCPAESEAVIDRINRLISDEPLRHQMLQELEKYTGNVSYLNMAKKVIEVYKDLTA